MRRLVSVIKEVSVSLSRMATGGAQFSSAASEIRLLKEDAVEDARRLANDTVMQLKAQLEAAQAFAATVATLQGAATPPSPPPAATQQADAASRVRGVEAGDVTLELLADEDGSPTEEWHIVEWIKGVCVHRAVAAALLAPLAAEQRDPVVCA